MSSYEKLPIDIHHYIFNDIYLYELLNMYAIPASKEMHYMLDLYGMGKLVKMIKDNIVNKLFTYVLRGSDLITILNSNITSSDDFISAFMKKNIKLSIPKTGTSSGSVSLLNTKTGAEYILIINKKGTILSEEWKLNSKPHRIGQPAYIIWYGDGTRSEYWYENGLFHRNGAPAVIERNHTGVKIEKWYKNNLLHRTGLPAYTEWYDNRTIKSEYWYENNQLHRSNGPAIIMYKQNGQKLFESWYIHGINQKEKHY